ncbi:helix-turn-helix transcriptional regulator [uncultured Desulfobacter sp.]|uniref:helix-turn-helix domain-containing protein n=1 Tax=uncultured Desulfobacter sp. TaxID=240139 RepID=UPI0029F4FE6A|nr:helix-turn-helix transcriptional regulator [uncultured Desulfobacter sp.]
MAELARSVGMCRTKLYDCFRVVYGITPFDYLRNKRLETAVKLLNEGKTNVTQASYAVGYASISHFSKTFKEHFGFSPGKHLKDSLTLTK